MFFDRLRFKGPGSITGRPELKLTGRAFHDFCRATVFAVRRRSEARCASSSPCMAAPVNCLISGVRMPSLPPRSLPSRNDWIAASMSKLILFVMSQIKSELIHLTLPATGVVFGIWALSYLSRPRVLSSLGG